MSADSPIQTPLSPKFVRTTTLTDWKRSHTPFAMLTSYDNLTAEIFDEAGIDVLLVGDSIGSNQLGFSDTVPVTLDHMVTATRAVSSAARRALVVADLPFGSYEASTEDAVRSAMRLMKEGGAQAVKLEGGERQAATIRAIVDAGIPVMAHVGFTPQSVHQLGGYKIQGKSETSAAQLLHDAQAVERGGAFSVVLELVPSTVARDVTNALHIPTIGIGAGNQTDGQVLVWTDFAGLTRDPAPKFVKRYAQLRATLLDAAKTYRDDVTERRYPDDSTMY